MGTNATTNPILITLLLCIGASVLLAGIGLALHRRGKLRAQGPALAWAILTILPLFGAGFAMFGSHAAEEATGVTNSGENAEPSRSAP